MDVSDRTPLQPPRLRHCTQPCPRVCLQANGQIYIDPDSEDWHRQMNQLRTKGAKAAHHNSSQIADCIAHQNMAAGTRAAVLGTAT